MTAPVLVIFFNRADTLKEVFSSVRKAQPEKLYLFQDGARADNERDKINIAACRAAVSEIDWPCEVHTNYQEKNLGCGKGPYTAINWVFEHEDRAIILEDDCVASQSFFPFCTEMLERYKDDERTFMVTGCNLELVTKDIASSYFFGYSGTNWGWATWKRNWIKMDYACSFTQDKKTLQSLKCFLERLSGKKGTDEYNAFIQTARALENGENISYWDVQWQSVRYLNHQLSVIPSHNLITNIGAGGASTHAKNTAVKTSLNTEIGKINYFFNQRFEMEFPLVHPKYFIQNTRYDKKWIGH